jgi:uncharacterized protein (TIGR02145 family)
MRTQLTKITLAAGLMLAMALTFNGCTRPRMSDEQIAMELQKQEQILIAYQKKARPETYDSLKTIYGHDSIAGRKLMELVNAERQARYDGLKAVYEQGVTVKIGDKEYKTILIDNQVWMAENLNIEVGNSVCYDNKEENCNQCGRLYDRETASKVCPEGWRFPNKKDWKSLIKVEIKSGLVDAMKSEWDGGADLKAKSGWDNNGNGNDKYGFSALPCGYRYYMEAPCAPQGGKMVCLGNDKITFVGYGSSASFWFSGTTMISYMGLNSNSDKLYERQGNMQSMFSVRCVRDISREDYQLIPTQANPQESIAEPEEATAPSDVPAEAQQQEGE